MALLDAKFGAVRRFRAMEHAGGFVFGGSYVRDRHNNRGMSAESVETALKVEAARLKRLVGLANILERAADDLRSHSDDLRNLDGDDLGAARDAERIERCAIKLCKTLGRLDKPTTAKDYRKAFKIWHLACKIGSSWFVFDPEW